MLVPDLQIPGHDAKAVAQLSQFIEQWSPDLVACVGDLIDMANIAMD